MTTNKGEGFKIIEPVCIHQVGRYPENPKSRQVGLPTEQMFEVKEMDGKCGTLTTVQKDNLIGEMIPLCTNGGGKAQTLKAQYYKSSAANFFNDEEKGCLYGASGVAERIPEYSSGKSRPLSASYAHKSDSMGGGEI